ncbi:hypothetical protein RM788_04090 [Umezawaea sp. Da 62-37]|nr:hypothetical protein [Umezawaea sp. Da 62-37]WNV87493.1 hypothetical protein RM788_04090 [Umezawaea sp. Da 62-37]
MEPTGVHDLGSPRRPLHQRNSANGLARTQRTGGVPGPRRAVGTAHATVHGQPAPARRVLGADPHPQLHRAVLRQDKGPLDHQLLDQPALDLATGPERQLQQRRTG